MQTVPKWMQGLAVAVGGHGVVSHVGTAGLRMLAFKSGLTSELTAALRVRGRQVVHDRGQVLSDLGVMIADGGTAIRHIHDRAAAVHHYVEHAQPPGPLLGRLRP